MGLRPAARCSRCRSEKFYSRIYASSANATKGLVKFDGGEAAGTNAQFTARGRTAKIVAVPAEGTLTASGAISVGAGVVFVVGENHPTATLTVYDNATLDLSRLCTDGVDVVFDAGNTTFQPGSTVYVKLGDRTIGDQNGKKLASWSVKPSGVKFVCGDEGKNYMLAAESDGLYIYRGFSVFLY